MERQTPIEERIGKVLKRKRKTLAVAESCTGGRISNLITNVSGSSVYFNGGVVAYSNSVKESSLGVPAELIEKHGAVSSQVARAMAKGAMRTLNADAAAAITGVAGPTGGTEKKPVGLAYIAFTSGSKVKTRKVQFKGNRAILKSKFSQAALELILRNV